MKYILEPFFSVEIFPSEMKSHFRKLYLKTIKIETADFGCYTQMKNNVFMLKTVHGFSLFSPDSHNGFNPNFHRFVISCKGLIAQIKNTVCDYFDSSTNPV